MKESWLFIVLLRLLLLLFWYECLVARAKKTSEGKVGWEMLFSSFPLDIMIRAYVDIDQQKKVEYKYPTQSFLLITFLNDKYQNRNHLFCRILKLVAASGTSKHTHTDCQCHPTKC